MPARASGPACPASVAILLVVVAVIYLFACWFAGRGWRRQQRDRFTSLRAQEVCQSTRALFDQTAGAATYLEYKTALGDIADPVLYTDVRRLWREGRLNPEEVEKCV